MLMAVSFWLILYKIIVFINYKIKFLITETRTIKCFKAFIATDVNSTARYRFMFVNVAHVATFLLCKLYS